MAGASGRVLAQLPERENLKKSIRRERNKNAPSNPKSLADLDDLPETYQRTVTGDNFLLYDSKAHGEIPDGRVLVFATRRNLEVLKECDEWYVDGTFKVSCLVLSIYKTWYLYLFGSRYPRLFSHKYSPFWVACPHHPAFLIPKKSLYH